jgi:hypothetical protein
LGTRGIDTLPEQIQGISIKPGVGQEGVLKSEKINSKKISNSNVGNYRKRMKKKGTSSRRWRGLQKK